MIRSALAVALLLTVLGPGTSAAQLVTIEPDPRVPRLRITPYAGYLVPFTRDELWSHPAGGDINDFSVTTSFPSGIGAGIEVDALIAGPIGVTVAGLAARRGGARFRLEGEAPLLLDGSGLFLGRAALYFRLPDESADLVNRRVRILVFGGGAMLHERPGNAFGVGNLLASATHYGASFGATAERAFSNNRFALQVGVEDHVIFWDEQALARLPAVYFGEPGTTVVTGSSHSWQLRAGFSVRF
jgi:hypothetical protein